MAAQDAPPWTEERPGGDTSCAFETPYRFFHRDVEVARDLLVYFQGGGACWEWVSCSGMFDTDVTPSEVTGYQGIFDQGNGSNPFREYAVLFIPYCTGDVHVGDAVVDYSGDGSSRPVHHRGYRNVTAALDWAETRARPEHIFVTGASAGSYGAVLHAPDIVRRFPGSRVVVLGDSGLPLLHDYPNVLRNWGSESVLAKIRNEEVGANPQGFTLTHAHVAASRSGVSRIAQVTSDHDAVQSAFYLISGSPAWREDTYALLEDLAVRVPEFRSFVVSGSEHGLLRTDRFYEYEAAGVRLRDWVADLATGHAVLDVRCSACTGRP